MPIDLGRDLARDNDVVRRPVKEALHISAADNADSHLSLSFDTVNLSKVSNVYLLFTFHHFCFAVCFHIVLYKEW